jgi:hypothetical protein
LQHEIIDVLAIQTKRNGLREMCYRLCAIAEHLKRMADTEVASGMIGIGCQGLAEKPYGRRLASGALGNEAHQIEDTGLGGCVHYRVAAELLRFDQATLLEHLVRLRKEPVDVGSLAAAAAPVTL